jgi:uncharacterized membrane protein (TIGR02234 family)
MTSRRELQLAVLLCLLGSALVLFALGQSWYSFEAGQRITIDAVRTSYAGSTLAPGAEALGYVGLAGVVALAATRRWGRLLVGLLVLAAGIGVVIVVSRALGHGIAEQGLQQALPTASCPTGQGGCSRGVAGFTPAQARTQAAWAWLTLAGGVLVALSGVLVTVRGRRWAALSSSYEPPSARASEPPATDKGVWDALDRGEDPTT